MSGIVEKCLKSVEVSAQIIFYGRGDKGKKCCNRCN